MDLLLAGVGGVTAKIYDDITDNNIIIDDITKSSLWTLSCFVLASLVHNDFIHGFLMYYGNLLGYFVNPETFKYNNEKSLLYIYPILLLFSLPSASSISIVQFLLIIFACFGVALEGYLFREEMSVYKVTGRIIISSLCVIWSFIKINGVSNHIGMQKVLFYAFGYFSLSYILLTFKLYQKYKYKELQKEKQSTTL